MNFTLASYLLQHLFLEKHPATHTGTVWWPTKPELPLDACYLSHESALKSPWIHSWGKVRVLSSKIEPGSPELQSNSLPFEPFSSVQFSRSVVSNSLRPHGLQHARLPCPSPTPRAYSDSCLLSRWCILTTSSSVVPFYSCLQTFPASGSFPVSQFSASGGQSIGASVLASVLPVNIQHWFPLGWTGWISLQSKGLSRVFSNTTVQKHQFFGAQLSL